MTTLTMMERTATGWKCPRCGSEREDDFMPLHVVACGCAWQDALHQRLETQGTNPGGPGLRGIALSTPECDHDVQPIYMQHELEDLRTRIEAVTGLPDRFRYRAVDEEESHEKGPDGSPVKVRRRVI